MILTFFCMVLTALGSPRDYVPAGLGPRQHLHDAVLRSLAQGQGQVQALQSACEARLEELKALVKNRAVPRSFILEWTLILTGVSEPIV